MNTTEQNKVIVTRFNKEFIEQGNINVFHELVADTCVNHTAPAGTDAGKNGMGYFLNEMLRPAFPDITVEIKDQVAEGNKVTSRKVFTATHLGTFMGIPATGKKVTIDVIDIITLESGKYVEHWGMSSIPALLAELAAD